MNTTLLQKTEAQLHDTNPESDSDDDPIAVKVELRAGRRDDGILIFDDEYDRARIMVENRDGELWLTVWDPPNERYGIAKHLGGTRTPGALFERRLAGLAAHLKLASIQDATEV